MFKAALAKCYGWTDEYISHMPYHTAVKYWRAVTVLEAQERLVDLNVADYPRMKQDPRSRLHKQLSKQAYPRELQKQISFEDFAKKTGLT